MKRLLCWLFGHTFEPRSPAEIKADYEADGKIIMVRCARCDKRFDAGIPWEQQ